ncbi:MAG TPA: class A beta-lactamase [Thermoanaerobaculia bacterium]|nr:class A beta-lactamase [Thermoanaerobaculia bacterium]
MLALILAAALQLPPQASDATIGVTAIHLETGQRLTVRNGERFPMGSVYKFPIALAVLQRVDQGSLSLSDSVTIQPRDFSPGHSPLRDEAKGKPATKTVREMLRYMVSLSDNTVCDYFLRTLGAKAVNARLAELGVSSGIRIDRTEKQMASDLNRNGGMGRYAEDVRDTATPDAMADLLTAFWQRRDGLSKESHDLLVHWMTVTPTGSRRVKAGIPKGATWVHKTGTMPGTTNDVGILVSPDGKQHIVLAVFTKASRRDITEDQEDDIAAIARKVWTLLAQ